MGHLVPLRHHLTTSPPHHLTEAQYALKGGTETMLYPFLVQAAQSPGRQQAFRQAVMVHLAILAGGVWMMTGGPPVVLGMMLLVAGIVEGAGLVGWRLTQLPKSRAL